MNNDWDTFKHYQQRGLDARRAGQHSSAKGYFLEAARVILKLSKSATSPELQSARRVAAERLLELARDCDHPRPAGTTRPSRSGRNGETNDPGDDNASDAQDWIVREKPTVRFDNVAGLEDVKEEIRLKMIYPFAHAEAAKKFGIRSGGGILLYGPPGTGKTLLARATAGELDATFFRVSPADLLSKWVGEAEQNIRKLFDAAAGETRAVIFIDEIEALVPARRDDGSSVMQRVVPQILQGMEGFDKKDVSPILFLGATNVPWQLDPAVLRPGRFDEKIYIPLPDLPARVRMLELYLADRPLADDVDLEAIAGDLEGYSGADLRYVCDRSALIPFMQTVAGGGESQITLEIIQQAIGETPRSVSQGLLERFDKWTAGGA